MFARGSSNAAIRLSQVSRQLTPHTQRASYFGTVFTLNTGATIPGIGFGTWQDKDAQEDAVYEAIKAGYRHIDTAIVYGTEPAVAKAIEKAGLPRSELFITTKLWNNKHHPDDVAGQLDQSLQNLKTDHVDLYLMHWPVAFARSDRLTPKENGRTKPGDSHFTETWKAMEELQQSGKVKAIGVSNFSRAEMEELLRSASIKPAVHQLEMHPYLAQKDFSDFHKQHDIHITHYSPFGNSNEIYSSGQSMGKLIDDPVLAEIGEKYGKSGAQVALAWGLAKGHSVIPKSKTPSRIKANLEADFKLDPEDVDKVDGLDRKLRFSDPSEGFGWDFFTDLDGKKKKKKE